MTREEAINEIRSWTFLNEKENEVIQTLIPELRESEDERVRKEIIEALKQLDREKSPVDTYHYLEWAAWLEKQKEPLTPEEKMNHPLYLEGFDVGKKVGEVLKEQKEKSEKPINLEQKEQKSVALTPEDYKRIPNELISLCNDIIAGREINLSADKKGADTLRAWLTELNAEQKPAEWSEEDEDMRDSIIRDLKFMGGDYPNVSDGHKAQVSWLKSLCPSWKPNDEDEVRLINTSISFLKGFADKGYENAVECIDWLKSKLNGNTCK